MHSIHFHHVHSAHRLKSEFSQVFVYRTIRALGISLFAVFLPIYLFESSSDTFLGLLLVCGYFATVFMVRMLATVPATNLVAKIGGKHVLIISSIVDVAFLISLAHISSRPYLLGINAVLHGLSSALFFTALHIELSHSIGKKKAHGVGSVEIARKITMALGPLLGGIIAGLFGFENLVYVAAAVVLVAILPLHTGTEPLRSSKRIKPHDVNAFLTHDYGCRANFGMALNTGAVMLLWPLFIFNFLHNYQSVGAVVSMSLVAALIIMIIVRKKESDTSISTELSVGGKGASAVHLVRAFAINPILITVVNVANDIFAAIFYVPYIAEYYKNASIKDRPTYIAAMEIAYSAGIIFLRVFFDFCSCQACF